MPRYAITSAFALSLTLTACESKGPAEEWSTQPPCPGIIPERTAVDIATELTQSQLAQYGALDVRADWNDATWTVFFTDRGSANWLTIVVRADGQITDCGPDNRCAPNNEVGGPACGVATGEFISMKEAVVIAEDYATRNNLISAPMQADSAIWFNAHWSVWIVPSGEAPVGSDATVYIRPDGSETEVIYHDGIPSQDSFLFRVPALH